MVKIITQNVRGLGIELKRRSVFLYLRQKCDIICLQETHSDLEKEKLWANEWGGKCYWSHGTTSKGGVGILIDRNLDIEILHHEHDLEGRKLFLQFRFKDELFVLANIYAPNEDNPDFFTTTFKTLENIEGQKIIVGDFNVALNVEIDRTESDTMSNNKLSCAAINQYMEDFELCDTWRQRNLDRKVYTWCRRSRNNPGKISGSRIDYVLTSPMVDRWISKIDILPSYKSDHSIILFEMNPSKTVRGRGMWKMNARILSEMEYLTAVGELIQKVLENNVQLNALELWESLKLEIIFYTQEYCQVRALNKKMLFSQLEQALDKLKKKENKSHNDLDLMERTQVDLDVLIEEKTKEAVFRSKAKWYGDSEKSSKYFMNLEKCRANAKNISCVLMDDGTILNDPQQVLKEQEKFYAKLYKKDENISFRLENNSEIKLTEEMKETAEGHFTYEEVTNAVKQIAKNKTPGCDGIPVEFYVIFWNKIGKFFVKTLEFAYDVNDLHDSAFKGVINLIPKKGKDSRVIKNLRPITLLNTDYKIIEKVLANRLKPLLSHLINEDQKGFMKNRNISCNIRRVLDLIELSDREDIPGLLISLDFEKCFDRIEVKAVLGALSYFNFGESFGKWTNLIYSRPIACVSSNGFFSNYFPVERSVKQGGCCSAYYFLIIAEVLAIELRKQSANIQGFQVKEIEKFFGQFADDLDVYVHGEAQSINRIFEVIDNFCHQSGFKVNYDKTSVYRIGSLKNSNAKLNTQKRLTWLNNNCTNILGVNVSTNKEKLGEINYPNLIEKAEAICKSWEHRGISLIGKILVVNVLVVSLFVYKMTVLPSMEEKFVKQLEKIIENFIWNGKNSPVKG